MSRNRTVFAIASMLALTAAHDCLGTPAPSMPKEDDMCAGCTRRRQSGERHCSEFRNRPFQCSMKRESA